MLKLTSPVAAAADFRDAAKRALPRMIFDYIDGGSFAEETLVRNVADFRLFELRQRVLRDASNLQLHTSLLGQQLSLPLMLAPVGMAGLYARRGEVSAARAATAAGITSCLSTVSVCSLEEVTAAAGEPPWFQLYMIKDRARMVALLERAEALGVPALMLTVDLAISGLRYRDTRTGFAANPSLLQYAQRIAAGLGNPRWAWDVLVRGRPHSLGNLLGVETTAGGFAGFYSWIGANFDTSATWKDIEWLRSVWKRPIILKGIIDREDARQAIEVGADGIVVSNHGGRQLDGVRSSIRALPIVAEAVDHRVPVIFDGGIRSGIDILKALALGADVCMIGRLWAYALAAQGEAGVARLIEILRKEIEVAMVLTGCTDISKADLNLMESVTNLGSGVG